MGITGHRLAFSPAALRPATPPARSLRRLAPLALLLLALVLPQVGTALAAPAPTAGHRDMPAAAQSNSAAADEQTLAEKYAPIAELKQQTAACDETGEPYVPSPVTAVLGDPSVVLRRDDGNKNVADDPVIKRGPTIQDLAGKDETYYLDLPGDPRTPDCTYEQFSKKKANGQAPVTYAHIATQADHPGIALQYWFFYVFNRFNNLHEADWEMIQLTFDGPTVADALRQQPNEVGFAQHSGGELAKWDNAKVKKDGDHPIVFPAAGSHATYYGSHTYLGWGEHGSGLGCDNSTGPSIRTPLQVQLVPDQPTTTGPFAWLSYQGKWGEKDSFPFDGPTGPNMKPQWTEPFRWQDDLRKSSLALPSQHTIGPNPTNFFCSAVATGAGIFTLHKHYPWLTYTLAALLVLAPIVLIVLMRQTLATALSLFARHAGIFLGLGAVMIVLGTIANLIEDPLRRLPLGGVVFGLMDLFSPSQVLFQTGGAAQQFIGWTIVTPAVIFAVAEIQAGRHPTILTSFRTALGRFWTLIRATAFAGIIVLGLAITIVGIPWAVMRAVRWLFLTQAVVLRNATWREARRVSQRAVIGRWWRAAALSLSIAIVLGVIAPLIGIVVLIWVVPSPVVANLVSGAIYALLFPLIGITMTLWFQRNEQPVAAGRFRWKGVPGWPRWRAASPEVALGGAAEAPRES